LRGLLKVNIEALLKATGQNIQQLLKTKTPGKVLNLAQAMTLIPYLYLKFFASLILPLIFISDFFNTLERFFCNIRHLVLICIPSLHSIDEAFKKFLCAIAYAQKTGNQVV
jgi:hypothetical protein